jgi:hypothetical protein
VSHGSAVFLRFVLAFVPVTMTRCNEGRVLA